MHTESDWLRAICENPYDMHLRMVYADWLDEQELHALQAKFIRCGDMVMGSRFQLNSTMQVLGGFNPTRYCISEWTDNRGFLSKIELPCSAFTTHCEAIFRAQPVTEVRLTDQHPIERRFSYDWEKYGSDLAGDFLIPEELFALLPDVDVNGWVWSATSDDMARICLSQACVSLGRKRAGLSSLSTVTR